VNIRFLAILDLQAAEDVFGMRLLPQDITWAGHENLDRFPGHRWSRWCRIILESGAFQLQEFR
jgi:hypothetical protein